MAVITPANYISVMNDYAAASDQLVGVSDNYYNAAYTVLLLNVFDPEIDLLIAFNNAYLTSQTAYASSPASVVSAVNTLQRHILARGVSLGVGAGQTAGERYDDVNDYYADHPAEFPTGGSAIIPQSFADLSSAAGHTIDSTYITP